MLCDFHLFHLLSQRGAVSGAILLKWCQKLCPLHDYILRMCSRTLPVMPTFFVRLVIVPGVLWVFGGG